MRTKLGGEGVAGERKSLRTPWDQLAASRGHCEHAVLAEWPGQQRRPLVLLVASLQRLGSVVGASARQAVCLVGWSPSILQPHLRPGQHHFNRFSDGILQVGRSVLALKSISKHSPSFDGLPAF